MKTDLLNKYVHWTDFKPSGLPISEEHGYIQGIFLGNTSPPHIYLLIRKDDGSFVEKQAVEVRMELT